MAETTTSPLWMELPDATVFVNDTHVYISAYQLRRLEDQLQRLEDLADHVSHLDKNMDQFFLLVNAAFIFFMQCGFAFVECGAVRSKNTTNILIQNMLDISVAGVAYWAIGFPLAHGDGNAFVGVKYWFSYDMPRHLFADWFFHFVFAATAASIVSGAVAERCEFVAYLVYSFLVTGLVNPIVTHWAWSEHGWLYQGISDSNGVNVSFQLVALGGFILLLGFLWVIGGAQASISQPGDGEAVATAMVNTVIGGSFGSFTSLVINKIGFLGNRQWSLLITLNGALTGMVSVCAGCNVYYPWAAAVVGAIGGVSFVCWSNLISKVFLVDDPLDATAVHLGGGMWGLLAAPILSRDTGIVFQWSTHSFYQLAWNIVGLLAIAGWTAVWSIFMFGGLKYMGILRVSREIESRGLDIPTHGEAAYPVEAYGHGWGERGDALKALAAKCCKNMKINSFSLVTGPEAYIDARSNCENPEVQKRMNSLDDLDDIYVPGGYSAENGGSVNLGYISNSSDPYRRNNTRIIDVDVDDGDTRL
ncbi:PREDICTED: putative ammonium transporter 1 [Priapulus caudatus]|uniref:Ammonium transporter 1 n=1 Tax=Priapulus caudatus TaxID=37621 RepID=A0ABM1EB39_PRICU|nr:PREDICTED: putative ammonium transporter 1 [Priapulus caudatus]